MIMTNKGLDLDFSETKKSLNIPVAKKAKFRQSFSEDPMFQKLGVSLKDIDYQQFVTRFRWVNLPEGLNSELFERIMYFSGSAMFFYIKELNRFYFLPYGMSGEETETGIDFYGQYNRLKPYSFNGSTDGSGEQSATGKKLSRADVYLSNQIRDNIRDIPLVETEEEARKAYENGAVICWDRTPQLSYFIDSRNRISQSYVKYLIEILIQTKSALINSSGFNMFSTETESAADILQLQIDTINKDRERGKLAGVVSSTLGEIQNLQSNAPNAMTDFWNTFVAADNLRLKSLGIQNDGMVQKKQYQNMQETSLDVDGAMQVYMNAYLERVKFAAIVNSIWGLGIYPEPTLLMNSLQADYSQDSQEQKVEEGDNSQAQEGTND